MPNKSRHHDIRLPDPGSYASNVCLNADIGIVERRNTECGNHGRTFNPASECGVHEISLGYVGLLACISFIFLACSVTPANPAGRRTGRARAAGTLSGSKTLIIAHRGGALEAPENSISAFLQARRAGVDGIETDLRLTLDGKVVLYHDARVGRVEWGQEEPVPDLSGLIEEFANWRQDRAEGYGCLAEKILIGLQNLAGEPETPLVSDITYSQLQADRTVRGLSENETARTPTLDEALRALPTGLIDLDIKPGPRLNELLKKTIAALSNFRDIDRVVIEPPDLHSAEMLRAALGPKVKLQVTPGLWLAEPFDKSLKSALALRPHSISVPYGLISRQLVELAHAAGVEVWAWTIDSPECARSLELMGVDAIKTDRPTALISTLLKNPN